MSSPPSRFRTFLERFPGLALGVLVLVVVLVLDFAAAALYRMVSGDILFADINRRAEKVYRKKERQYRVRVHEFHHGFLPGIRVEDVHWGGDSYTMITNGLGYKSDRTDAVAPVSDRERLLFLGDSFTEGVGLDHAATFVGRIEAALAPQDVEVFNGGVSSYSPMLYWRRLAHEFHHQLIHPELVAVYIDISDIDDDDMRILADDGSIDRRRHNSRHRPRNIHPRSWFYSFTREHTLLTHVAYRSWADIVSNSDSVFKQKQIGLPRARWTVDEAMWEFYGEHGLARARDNMDQVLALLLERDIDLVIAVYPWPDQVWEKDLDSIQVRSWREWAQSRGVDMIDYFPCFISEQDTTRDARDTIRRYFIPGDVHWNAAGHELIAGGFLDYYRRQAPGCVQVFRAPNSGGD